jgi:hypothetical protein
MLVNPVENARLASAQIGLKWPELADPGSIRI